MTTTSGYSGQLGGQTSRYDQNRNESLLDYPGAQMKIGKLARWAAVPPAPETVAVDETERGDGRQTGYGDRWVLVMGSAG